MQKMFISLIISLLFIVARAQGGNDSLYLVKTSPDTSSLDTCHSGGEDAGEEEAVIVSDDLMHVKSIRELVKAEIFDYKEDIDYTNWNTIDIHKKMYDFFFINDTLPIVLNDTLGHRYVHPTPGRVTSKFGVRRWRFHYGTDIKLQTGDSVYNCFDGVVRISKRSRSYGNVILVRHNNGLETLYAHLSKRHSEVGDKVKAGDCLGLGGNTGRSYGSHLHFEIRFLGEALNPEHVIDFANHKLIEDTLLLSKAMYYYHNDIKELSKMVWHTIRKGDTLGHLSRKYGTSINAICALNGIKRSTILRIGKQLRVR